jgi:hypothetical protein
MIEAGRGRLNPAEAASPDDIIPGDGHLAVAAEDVGRREQFGNSFLSGVDDVGMWSGGRDLVDVFWLNRVTKNDPGTIFSG